MKDYLNNELALGDKVVFVAPYHRFLITCEIIKFTPKNIRIKYIRTWIGGNPQEETIQCPGQVVKVMK